MANVLVIYYTRTGNMELMARDIGKICRIFILS